MSKGRKPGLPKAARKSEGVPSAPTYLDEVAKKEFNALARTLDESGKLPNTDPKLIELYAANYSLLMRAVTELSNQPLQNEKGRPNSLIAVVHNCTQKVRQVIADLALSPTTSKLADDRLPPSAAESHWGDDLDD